MGTRGRALGVFSAAALVLSGMMALGGSAQAATLACGDTVTTSVTLSNDLSCTNQNGLIIGASNITVNLGGHTITGSNTTNSTSNEYVGILIEGVQNVTVQNGTVQKFDAGVAIVKGSKHTLTKLVVRRNINHSSLTGTNNKCNYGDGITVTGSDHNVITQNKAIDNGPFSGIALVGNSDNNIVSGNRVFDQTVSNQIPDGPDEGTEPDNGPCGPFSETPTGQGRLHQDIGIRIEGPGADNNKVLNNTSTDNQLNGISIHGYVCGVAPFLPAPGKPNRGNLVQGNNVQRNGFAGPDEKLDGIGILRQGPLGTVTCGSDSNSIIGNTSVGNARSGIFVTATGDNSVPSNNTVSQNTVNNNGGTIRLRDGSLVPTGDGIRLDGPFTVCPLGQRNGTAPTFCNVPREPRNGSNNNTLISNKGMGNVEHDGHDANPACDNNFWKENIFGTVNQACVAANGGTGTDIGPPIP
jgi:parallel beta-helix repeat protein